MVAQKITGQGVGDEFAGFGDSVEHHERPKSRPRLLPGGTRPWPEIKSAMRRKKAPSGSSAKSPHGMTTISPASSQLKFFTRFPWKWRGERFVRQCRRLCTRGCFGRPEKGLPPQTGLSGLARGMFHRPNRPARRARGLKNGSIDGAVCASLDGVLERRNPRRGRI